MIGVRPVSCSTVCSQLAVQLLRAVTPSPPLASRSSTGGSVPAPWNDPTLDTKYFAWAGAVPTLGRAKW